MPVKTSVFTLDGGKAAAAAGVAAVAVLNVG